MVNFERSRNVNPSVWYRLIAVVLWASACRKRYLTARADARADRTDQTRSAAAATELRVGAHGAVYDESDSRAQRWFGFRAVRELRGLPPEILMVPLTGHTRGHVGVAVDTGNGWLLHAGDAYTYHGQMQEKPSMPLGVRVFQRYVDTQRQSRIENQQRLRELVRDNGDEVTVFSAHCATEFERLRR